MSYSDFKYYIALIMCFVICLVAYDIGYLNAQEKYQTNIKYRCHDEIVYKWTSGYWEKLNQACKSEIQLKETT